MCFFSYQKRNKSVLETRPEIAVVRENPVSVELGGQLPVDWPLLMSMTWPWPLNGDVSPHGDDDEPHRTSSGFVVNEIVSTPSISSPPSGHRQLACPVVPHLGPEQVESLCVPPSIITDIISFSQLG